MTNPHTHRRVGNHLRYFKYESVSFSVAWNILHQAPKLDFEDNWSDRVFRQIRWKPSKEWGDRQGWTHRAEVDWEWQRNGPNGPLPQPAGLMTSPCVHLDVSPTGSQLKFLCRAYILSLGAKSVESAVITITPLLSAINRRACASVEQGFECSFT